MAELTALAHAVLQPGFVGTTPPAWLRDRLAAGLGGVALFARNVRDPEQVAKLTAAIHAENPQALVAIDEEGGDVTRMEHATGSSWPGNLALGVVDDLRLTRRVACGIGADLAGVGIDLDYAPSADANSNPANPVIGVRAFGSDPGLVARHTAAFVTGLQSAGVLSCAKHFPGHGDTDVDSHLALPVALNTAHPLADGKLTPFVAAIQAGVAAVMSAHIVVPGVDDRPATVSRPILTDLLRNRLGFDGLVLTDGIEMAAISATIGIAEGAVQAVAAGADAVCIGGGLADEDTVELLVLALVQAVREGRLSEERLADAAGRVDAAAARVKALREEAPAVGCHPSQLASNRSAGLEAARRALRGHSRPAPLSGSPMLLDLVPTANIAVGTDTASGLRMALQARWPDLAIHSVGAGDPVDVGLIAADRRPLIVVLHDAHRRPWMQQAATRLLAVRPDAITVEVGVPGWQPPGGRCHLATYGAALVCGQAAVEWLTG